AIACSPARGVDRNVIVYGVRVAPNSLDPRIANDEATERVAQLVYNSLMKNGDDLRIAPELAERLEHPDPPTYPAVLRRGGKFHDGHELTSRDVLYTFNSILAPTFTSPFKGAFKQLASISADGDYAVVFKLTQPFAAFPIQLVLPIVPDGAGDSLRTHPVGTGPY